MKNQLAEVKWLLEMALARLNANEPENAVWRLADAAGLLREALPQMAGESLIGRDEPTGRGFILPVAQEDDMTSAIYFYVLRDALRGKYKVIPAPNLGNPRFWIKGA